MESSPMSDIRRPRRLRLVGGAVATLLALSGCAAEPVVRLPEEPTFSAPAPTVSSIDEDASAGSDGRVDTAAPSVACEGDPLEVAGREDPSVTVTGDCPVLTVRGNDLIVDASLATVGELAIRADRVAIDAGPTGTLVMDGYDNDVEVGSVASVTVAGDRNTVRAGGSIETVSVRGDDTTVRTESGIDRVEDTGERNSIR
ncbi:DUF3060 domain-containing protein [Microbacterium xanthum]|uniref:DUF3060 domain-containing protein n=1 Tax=Microbacterium xanthum TaxID=3079794 RepID=UPI002AD2D97E|nr:DUF3060 domain-containing protein [Microbacterium sp. KSW-48]MDZ8172340.1 DUF3060 domain-containing protein [Microbacterium sp. KSW-48]